MADPVAWTITSNIIYYGLVAFGVGFIAWLVVKPLLWMTTAAYKALVRRLWYQEARAHYKILAVYRNTEREMLRLVVEHRRR